MLLVLLLLPTACTIVSEDEDDDGPASTDDDQHDDDNADDDAADDDTSANDGLAWVEIPGGHFAMGCSPGDAGCFDNESPSHNVAISPFALTATEITQAQYTALTGVNPNYFADCADCPVEQVSWFDADAFCQAVGGRLPTEAEWEYAARAGAGTIYPCGDDPACVPEVAWFFDNAAAATHAVAQRDANDFGLYDMLGNVWEWTADWYAADYYAASPSTDPAGPDAGASRVLRGGAYNNDVSYLRASFRNYDQPDDLSRAAGFRCARDAAADAE